METVPLGWLRGIIGRVASLVEPTRQGEQVGEHQLSELVERLCVVFRKRFFFMGRVVAETADFMCPVRELLGQAAAIPHGFDAFVERKPILVFGKREL